MEDLNRAGIYKITNTINNKCYIGLAKNIANRWNQHRNFEVNDNSKKLYWAFQEYGIENFTFEVIMFCEPNKLAFWEKHFIEQYDSYRSGYNNSFGGEGGQTETFSDKFMIEYGIKIFDNLTYQNPSYNVSLVEKFTFKRNKKQAKYDKKINKRKIKSKPVEKLMRKSAKKISKIQAKIDSNQSEVDRINKENAYKRDCKVEPIRYFVQEQNWHDFSYEDLQGINIQTISSKIHQRNHIKYKNYSWESTVADVKFSRNNILFKVAGFKDLKVEFEKINDISIVIKDDFIWLYFNNSLEIYNKLVTTEFLSSDRPDMPDSPIMYFYNNKDLFGFISSLKRMLGK